MNWTALANSTWVRRGFLASALLGVLVTLYFRIGFIGDHTLDTGGFDNYVVQGIVRLLDGHPLYTDPERPPFAIVQYTPLHHHLIAAVCRMIGVGPTDVQAIYATSRTVILGFNLLAAFLLFRIARATGLDRIWAAGIAALFFTGLVVFYYTRTDSTYILLFWAHVLAFIRAFQQDRPTWRTWVLPALLAVLTIGAKQSGVLAPLIAGLFLMHQRRWRDLMALTTLSVAFGLLGLWLVSLRTDPLVVYKNVVLGVANGFSPHPMIRVMTSKYGLIGHGWTLLGIWASVVLLRRHHTPLPIYLALGTLLSLAWALFTGLKAGMNINYFTEHYIFASLAVAWWAFEATRLRAPAVVRVVFVVYLPLLCLLRSAMYFSAFEVTRYYADRPDLLATEQAIVDRIRPGLDDSTYVFMTLQGFTELLLPHHVLLPQRDIIKASGENLRLSHDMLFDLFQAGRVHYLLTPIQDSVPPFEGYRFDAYVPWFDEGHIRVWTHVTVRNAEPGMPDP